MSNSRDGGKPVGDNPVTTQRSRKAATPGHGQGDQAARRADPCQAVGNVAEPQLVQSSLMVRPHADEHPPSRTSPGGGPAVLTAAILARSFAIAFERLRELERTDPGGAAHLRATIAAEVRGWYAIDAMPLEVR